ncbi:MAG: hypothetical protein JXJ22_09625 [Bacteroidales bacterium]|nr:hypothetical protein [Bacteroidales bacterium]
MKTIIISSTFCLFFLWSGTIMVLAQNNNQPRIKTDVNREYDKNGNLTRFDSTYSYSWSSNGEIPDSIMQQLHNFGFHFEFPDFEHSFPFNLNSNTFPEEFGNNFFSYNDSLGSFYNADSIWQNFYYTNNDSLIKKYFDFPEFPEFGLTPFSQQDFFEHFNDHFNEMFGDPFRDHEKRMEELLEQFKNFQVPLNEPRDTIQQNNFHPKKNKKYIGIQT